MQEQEKNPFNYGYKEGQKIEIDGNLLLQLIKGFDTAVSDEYVDIVKVDTSEEGDFDAIGLLEKPTELYLTRKGQYFSKLGAYLQTIHFNNIDDGVAVPLEELRLKKVD